MFEVSFAHVLPIAQNLERYAEAFEHYQLALNAQSAHRLRTERRDSLFQLARIAEQHLQVSSNLRA